LGFVFFVGDIISGVSFKPFWPRLLGSGPQLQEGSISLKFSVETKLKCKVVRKYRTYSWIHLVAKVLTAQN